MVEVGDKVFVSPLHGQKDNLAVIKTKTPEVGDKVFVSPLYGQKDNLAVIKTKTPKVGDKVFVSPLYGQKDNLAIISRTADNGEEEKEEEMLIDISPSSQYYVTRDAAITWKGTCPYIYSSKISANNGTTTLERYIELDFVSLMEDMTAPGIVVYSAISAEGLLFTYEYFFASLRIRPLSQTIIACTHYNKHYIKGGVVNKAAWANVAIANLESYKTNRIRIGLYAQAKSTSAHTVELEFSVSGHIGLYEMKS